MSSINGFSLCCPSPSYSSTFFNVTPSLVSVHLAVIPVPVSSLPLFQFISPPHFFQMTWLCSPPITSAHCGLLPGSPALHLFPLWTWLSLSEIGVSYFDFLSPPPCSLHLLFSFWRLFVCSFIYIQREWVVVGLSGWIDGWQEAMGEGIWALDGCFCQSECYLKDWLVPYFKNGEAMLARSRYSPPNCSFNTSVLLMLIDLTHINIILI